MAEFRIKSGLNIKNSEELVKETAQRVYSRRPWYDYEGMGDSFVFSSERKTGSKAKNKRELRVSFDGETVRSTVEHRFETVFDWEKDVSSVDEAVEAVVEGIDEGEARLPYTEDFRDDVLEAVREARGEDALEEDAKKTAQKVVQGDTQEELTEWARNSESEDLVGFDTAEAGESVERIRGMLYLADVHGYIGSFSTESRDRMRRLVDDGVLGGFEEERKRIAVLSRSDMENHGVSFDEINRYEQTIAHELGHAISYHYGKEIDGFFTDFSEYVFGHDHEIEDSEVESQLKLVSNMIRDEVTFGDGTNYAEYRAKTDELFADWIAALALKPEWTKENSPRVFETVQTAVEQAESDEAFKAIRVLLNDGLLDVDYSFEESRDLRLWYQNPWQELGGW